MANNTSLGKNRTTFYDLSITKRVTSLLDSPSRYLIFSAMVSIVVISLILNAFSLTAIKLSPRRTSSQFRLLASLAAADILAPLLSSLYVIISRVFIPSDHCLADLFVGLYASTFCAVFFNLLAMAFDQYIAVFHPLRHCTIMSNHNTKILVVCLWTAGAILGFSEVFPCRFLFDYEAGYCRSVRYTNYHSAFLVYPLVFLCLVAMAFVYLRIYLEVLKKQRNERIPFEANKKTLITMLLILGSYVVCVLPMALQMIKLASYYFLYGSHDYSSLDYAVSWIFYNFLLLNSVLDPLIYALRIPEVRHGYRKMFGCCVCLRRHSHADDTQRSQNTLHN